ncbi:MAG: metallophosphoesterase [Bacteroidetes bacterium]|nr:metallophosphoesterase [Bacteroidota bacterium]
MKASRILLKVIILSAITVCIFLQSCKKKETPAEPVYLSVELPKLVLQSGLYYPADNHERTIELEFSQAIDTASIRGNISLSDMNGSLDSAYTLISLDRKIVMFLKPDFSLKPGWRYLITITTGLRSVSGITFSSAKVIEIRTRTTSLTGGQGETKRDAILCISDIHMGEYRAVAGNYCWFSKNEPALLDLLDTVLTSQLVRQVVIMGDLFDEWVIPYRLAPFDTISGIHNSRDYFLSVAGSPVNLPVINKLREIAAGDSIQLIYVPGNHDMLLTRSILEEIIPGVVWQGTVSGLGNYSPVNEIIMEHGHRFDLFNCPQPLVNSGHMLPPGYFISRLQAEGLMENPGHALKSSSAPGGSSEFLVAWTLAYEYLLAEYSLTGHPDSANILMNGIDGYSGMYSYNGVRDMYAASIENSWPATQQLNAMPLPIPVLMAILDGTEDLFLAASYEYLSSSSPARYKIAAFGHTHKPELKVTPAGNNYQGIYANSGSWVNAELCSNPVRTFLLIWPGQWTGSDLDVVALYQYNLDSNSGGQNPDYTAVRLAEESIIK